MAAVISWTPHYTHSNHGHLGEGDLGYVACEGHISHATTQLTGNYTGIDS